MDIRFLNCIHKSKVHILQAVQTQKGCDIREGLFKAFCDRNITLLEMHSAVKSLEDVFLELTGKEKQNNVCDI